MLTIAGGIVIAFLALGALGAIFALFSHPAAWVVLLILIVVGVLALVPGAAEPIFAFVIACVILVIPVAIIRTLLGY